ncbi:uncharacterized protein [Euwallacea fornicatus]|uniref:uncharacterized protein n=1 Tax=Euwallacea fornicatus TaxID=995702 RepID=UPI00338FB41C
MVCNGCELSLKDFIVMLSDRRQFVDFLINHGLLVKYSYCKTCKNRLEININSLLFTCGRKYKKSKKVKKCALKKMQKEERFPRQQFTMKELKCNSNTVVKWSSYCRELCIQWVLKNSEKIGGVGKIVEIDEAKFGKRKFNRGRRIQGKLISGGFERDTKRVFLVPVENRTSQTLLQIIKEWIHPGTTIVSDCWRAYDVLKNEEYQHLQINHSLQYVDSNDPQIHTQNVERIWRDIRGGIPRYGRKEPYFVGYLAEFLFKRSFPLLSDIHYFSIEIAKGHASILVD